MSSNMHKFGAQPNDIIVNQSWKFKKIKEVRGWILHLYMPPSEILVIYEAEGFTLDIWMYYYLTYIINHAVWFLKFVSVAGHYFLSRHGTLVQKNTTQSAMQVMLMNDGDQADWWQWHCLINLCDWQNKCHKQMIYASYADENLINACCASLSLKAVEQAVISENVCLPNYKVCSSIYRTVLSIRSSFPFLKCFSREGFFH